VQLWRVVDGELAEPTPGCGLRPVAGGPGCAETKLEIEEGNDPCRPPCLTVDVSNHIIGEVRVQIDPTEFGPVLERDEVYRLVLPALANVSQMTAPALYRQAFWDACGMPLVTEGAIAYSYDFKIDRPKCKEDVDQDDVQLSCDNAPNVFNPDQEDIDRDGIGDVIDLCPTVPGAANNSADSDKDGVGNDCDNCRQTTNQ